MGSCWISPYDLAKYDCIVTDFTTLSKELYFTETTDRTLRQTKKFVYPSTPLLQMNFWRIILDEAQMVEQLTTRPAQMVKQFSAVYRWCSTGTPIEKGSVHDLYGLIYFLDYHPYTDYKLFNKLWFDYRNGNSENLINLLSKIMWRTCKKDVEHEIQIPEQKEIIHYVEMSDLQKCFYEQVHKTTKPLFKNHVREYLLRHSKTFVYDEQREETVKIIDTDLLDKKLFEFDNTSIKTFLEPLRKIRQDCTIANLYVGTNNQTKVKQTLRAEQLHEHLVSKASIECKSALRTICSSLNGMAAIKIAEENYHEAIDLYKQVLKMGSDYKGTIR
jgi:E3 ubiquitin-protein ligase SHPRH